MLLFLKNSYCTFYLRSKNYTVGYFWL